MTDKQLIECPVRVAGEYRMVLNAGTDKEQDTGWFDNMILDNGLNMLGAGQAIMLQNCAVGTGTTAPAAGQTALTTFLVNRNGKATDTATNVGSTTYAGQSNGTYVFPQGAVVGNLAEVGIGPATNGTNLFSRARIVDGSGTPTTITVVALDQLTVHYRITVTPVVTDLTGSFLISGVSYNYVIRLALASGFMSTPSCYTGTDRLGSVSTANTFAYSAASVLGAITANPTGTNFPSSSYSNTPYVAGTFYNDVTIAWNSASGNALGGIGAIMICWGNTTAMSRTQMSFSPAIPKDNTKTLNLVFRVAWSR